MSSCSLVTVHASLKNMVSKKTRLKFLVPKHEVEHDVTKKFMTSTIFRIPAWNFTCVFLNTYAIEYWWKKNIDFFTHLQEKLPLIFSCVSMLQSLLYLYGDFHHTTWWNSQ